LEVSENGQILVKFLLLEGHFYAGGAWRRAEKSIAVLALIVDDRLVFSGPTAQKLKEIPENLTHILSKKQCH
jgi:hypothetical protein